MGLNVKAVLGKKEPLNTQELVASTTISHGGLAMTPTINTSIYSSPLTSNYNTATRQQELTTQDETHKKTLATMSKKEVREAIGLASENGGGDYLSYKAAFITLQQEFVEFFMGIDAQTSALGFNPLQKQLTDALNNNPAVAGHLITIAENPKKLKALTNLVTDDDGNPATFLADEGQISNFINTLALSSGVASLATKEPIQSMGNLVESQAIQSPPNGLIINEGDSTIKGRTPSIQVPEVSSISQQIDVAFTPPTQAVTLPTDQENVGETVDTGTGIEGYVEKSNLSFGQRFASGEIPSSIGVMKTNFDAAQHIDTSANIDAELGIKEIAYEAGQKLDHLVRDHYKLTDPNMIHRASLIIASGSNIPNANAIKNGAPIKLPPMDMLKEAAGSDTLSLRNLDTHPAQIGEQLKVLMQEPVPEARQATYPIGQTASLG